eukprot:gb/GFBE01029583.1/.p1 GENE.gb/GFBE01029583.1/~~gb/GFBE01029583.1/.p1  ORF type:complete len:794 (+),score=118.53 gb/GFBE01029583.1/:1-2382(+)
MGSCCMGCSRTAAVLPEPPFDHTVYVEHRSRRNRTKVWEAALKGGGQELMRFSRVEDLRGYPPTCDTVAPVGVLVLTELFLWWHSNPSTGHVPDAASSMQKPARPSRTADGSTVIIGYSAIEEVGIVCFDSGGCAVRIVTREQAMNDRFEMVVRVTQGQETPPGWTTTIPEESGAEGNDQWHQALATALDRALKAYSWAHHFLHCALRQRDLFAHSSAELPELALLPNEEVTQCFGGILNFGASQEDLVGHLIVTNCRVVWALDRDRTTYNVSVPHRAHVPTLTDTQTFGLCMVLYIRQPFMNNSEHVGGMRLGFGVASSKGSERKERLEHILEHVKRVQGEYLENPKYGVADYMSHRRQYQVESHVRLLHALSRLDMISEGTRPETMESHLQGEVCECVICLDQVCSEGPLAYLLAAGKLGWACKHIFHLQCAQQLLSRRCPVCRTSFSEVREMPDIRRSPGAWFDAMDVDRTGDLDLEEVLGALAVVLPVDRDKMEDLLRPPEMKADVTTSDNHVEDGQMCQHSEAKDGKPESPTCLSMPSSPPRSALWHQWDKQGTGKISRQDFEDPEGGLLVWILARLKLVHRGQRPRPCIAAAASLETLGRWFDFWDWSQVGFLTRGQVTRAVAREFEGRLPDLKCLEIVQEVWRQVTEATISKPVAPPSGIVSNNPVPDEEPGSPSQGQRSQDRILTAHADPWHLREGICSRGDFLEGGLGSALRVKLLDATAERSAAGRHRQLSKDQAMFSFEEALAMAGDGPGGSANRLIQSLTDCTGKRRPPGQPEPLADLGGI